MPAVPAVIDATQPDTLVWMLDVVAVYRDCAARHRALVGVVAVGRD